MLLPIDIDSVKGFLDPKEGEALYQYCLGVKDLGPTLEIGSYCGKSTVYLGAACKQAERTLYAVDHHRGSEEHQLGEEYHDPELYDGSVGLMDSFKAFRSAVRAADLDDYVVPLVASSKVAARDWKTPLGMVFIDGGHSLDAALADFNCWSNLIVAGGILAIHDIFPDPNDGGQAPYTIWKMALDSNLFEDLGIVGTLGVLRRKHG
ncbi:MAG: class I SAM-dependent methyltransferase [Pseudomonadales bacterium]|jgi:predicted O-methyltransferase YrrM|nr:class I SAM-dependent methyltransferase [Pseudomonadales bacterium]MDG1444444.1 class I SAM-dependent methyltransferase [Pseudomonadales bacterium]